MTPLGLSPLTWSTVALSLALIAVAAVLVLQIVRGRVAITVPWGRRFHQVTERSVRIDARRAVVIDVLRAAARGATRPLHEGERTALLDEEGPLIVNESVTRSRYGLVEAVELIRLSDERVTYRHLRGPLPGTEEEFVLREDGGGTLLTYRGRIPVSFWSLGSLVARFLIVPEYDRLIVEHLGALERTCKERARGRS